MLPPYIFETYLERPSFDFCQVHQVHGINVIEDRYLCGNSKADGILSYELRKPLVVKTADCLPVAVIGHTGAALLHVGWRGLAKNILEYSPIDRISPRSFFVGPHITEDSFEITGRVSGTLSPFKKLFFRWRENLFFPLR